MTSRPGRLISIPRSDKDGSRVLLWATPSSPASDELDARLEATEGEEPYFFRWSVNNVDATATVVERETITITIRRRVQDITQRLGTLCLTFAESTDIQIFDWCVDTMDRKDQAVRELAKAEAERTALQATVDDLKAQLDEFLRIKEADETALLSKFCLLLNEKKATIRQQQRQLHDAGRADAERAQKAQVEAEIKEEEEDDEMESAPVPAPPTRGRRGRARAGRSGNVGRGAKTTTAATARRGSKRRAAAAASDVEDADSDDDGFAKPAFSRTKGSARQVAQHDQNAAVTEIRAEPADDTGTESEVHQTTENEDESTQGEEEPEPMQEDAAVTEAAPTPEEAPPPRRALVFGKDRGAASGSTAVAPVAVSAVAPSSSKAHNVAGSDSSETDDEL
ncbi:hypothetical protein SEPCBS119000_001277 [Sporothrix epigloea]|uniref:XRCC4 coiled-coil domain-containing protein n=1 Tax=Sporothrix epigloea TaxID=1892477 RepID=A0ABP0D9T3_9PEZI